MRSLSNLGLSLCVIFAFLFFALVAELYYLWWKKSCSKRETGKRHGSAETELFFMFCKRRSSSISQKARSRHEREETKGNEPGSQLKILQSKKDFLAKPFAEEEEEDDLEAELMRLQGPPRFLYTIIEETREDLEAEDLILTVETPFLTPLNSPSLFPSLSPTESYKQNGFNPLCESMSDAEFNKIRSSPPPTFKFLQDAEEKLRRKLMAEAKRDVVVEDGSCITVMVDMKKDQESNHHPRFPQLHLHSNNWQVLPLDYSPQNHLQKAKNRPLEQIKMDFHL